MAKAKVSTNATTTQPPAPAEPLLDELQAVRLPDGDPGHEFTVIEMDVVHENVRGALSLLKVVDDLLGGDEMPEEAAPPRLILSHEPV